MYGPGSAIASVSGSGRELVAAPSTPSMVDRIVIQEDIRSGERIRAFQVDVLLDGRWILAAKGTAIGHKGIVTIRPAQVESVRLRVTDSVGEPVVLGMSLHRAGQDGAQSSPR